MPELHGDFRRIIYQKQSTRT